MVHNTLIILQESQGSFKEKKKTFVDISSKIKLQQTMLTISQILYM